jgi:hypothetical protein
MDNLNLNNNEITIINDALNGRINTLPINDETNIKTKIVQSSFIQDGNVVKPKDRTWVIGCIREYYIERSKELFNITDFDAVMAGDDILKRMIEIDIALALINKLQKKSEKKLKLFHEKYSKLSELGELQKVLFSESNNGQLYKIGLLFTNGKGLRFDNETGPIKNINVEKVILTDFECELTGDKFITKLKDREKINRLSILESQILSIIEKYK